VNCACLIVNFIQISTDGLCSGESWLCMFLYDWNVKIDFTISPMNEKSSMNDEIKLKLTIRSACDLVMKIDELGLVIVIFLILT